MKKGNDAVERRQIRQALDLYGVDRHSVAGGALLCGGIIEAEAEEKPHDKREAEETMRHGGEARAWEECKLRGDGGSVGLQPIPSLYSCEVYSTGNLI